MSQRSARPPLMLAAVAAALVAGCGGGEEDAAAPKPAAAPAPALTLTVETAPGKIKFDKKRLTAKAGKVAIELVNPTELGHNVRIATGSKCCMRPDAKDVGGTGTIGRGKTRAVVELQPGEYVFYCAIGGHWQRGQQGRLLVQ